MKKLVFVAVYFLFLAGVLATSAVASSSVALGWWEWKGEDNENVLFLGEEGGSEKFSGHFLNRRGGEDDGFVSSFSLEKIVSRGDQGEKISFLLIPRSKKATGCSGYSAEGTVTTGEMFLVISPVGERCEKENTISAVFKRIVFHSPVRE